MSQVVITNLGPDPVHVTDATGTHSDLGAGSHGTFAAPVKVGDGSASAPVESPAPAPAAPNAGAVLTEADSLADLNGTPRPDNPTVVEDPVEAQERLLEAQGVAV